MSAFAALPRGSRLRRDESAIGGLDDPRTDRADLVGAGVGYRVRENARIGFNWEFTERHSDRPERQYERHRLFATFTYGQ